jgi:polysaccharide chain length determinant protein (PEP-CTERM system associated)
LYQEERKKLLMEDVVALMQRDVSIQIPRTRGRVEPTYFGVSFVSENPRSAMQVTERLASMFITENLQDRTVQADQTTQFLSTQLEEARRQLAEREQQLERFRRTYSGQLPSQVQSNLQVMQSTQSQLQALVDAANRDHDRQLVLDKTIADLLASANSAPPAVAVERNSRNLPAPSPTPAADQLAAARTNLDAMLLRLKPEHPDVIRAKRTIRDLERKAEAEALNTPLVPEPERPVAQVARLSTPDQRRLSDMQAERESLDRRIAASHDSQQRLEKVIGAYRGRVEAAPAREAEVTELTRDYETLKANYLSLLARSEQSKIAADLERRQIGEQFKLIDAARLPEKPENSNRLKLDVMGALAGLGFGLALIGLLEYRDTSLRTDDDVIVSLALPVLAVIPAMLTREERRRKRRRIAAALSASAVATIAMIAVAVWKFNLLQSWMR